MPRRADPRRRPGESDVGFALQLDVLPGLPLAECRRLERRLEDYAEAQGLRFEGTQLRHVVSSPERGVSVNDQVALLDWLVDQPGLVGVRLGPIAPVSALGEASADPDEPGDEGAFVQVRTGDLALIGLTLLYRCGRIAPVLYLQILGGYVRPVHVH